MALNSSDVSAGDDILATHLNFLIDDMEQHTHDGTDTTKVDFAANPETRYLAVSCAAWRKYGSNAFCAIIASSIKSTSSTEQAIAIAPVNLPHGAIVTSFRVYWYRADALSSGLCRLSRHTFAGGSGSEMAAADSNASTGYHNVTDTTISDATIDNTTYIYNLKAWINPNDDANDVQLNGLCLITYTITEPLP